MQIVDNKIKPCPNCLRARQLAKDTLARATGQYKRWTLAECERGDVTIDNDTKKISAVSFDGWSDFVGKNVYVSGQWIFDVAAAKPIGVFGPIIKITKTD